MIMDVQHVQEYTENGVTYRVGQSVRRVDFENDGTPAWEGTISIITVDGDEVTYWVV